MAIKFTPIATEIARAYQAGGADVYGMLPERKMSDGQAVPCRHCLQNITAGATCLILAHRPFPNLQPYAETGPIFLCADQCAQGGGGDLPAILGSPNYILRGYSADNRIVYGTGKVTDTTDIQQAAEALLVRADISYAHVRSASNNCFQVRVDRA